MNDTSIEVLVVVATLVAALGGAWLGGWMSANSKAREWRRELRLRAYVEAINAARATIEAGHRLSSASRRVASFARRFGLDDARTKRAMVLFDERDDERILATRSARDAADEVRLLGSTKVQQALDGLLEVVERVPSYNSADGDNMYVTFRSAWRDATTDRQEAWDALVAATRADLDLAD